MTPRRLSERLAGLPVLRDSALLHHAAYQARVLLQRRHLTVRLDTNNRCNLRCRMCYFSLPELDRAPRRELTLPEFRALAAAAFPRARRVFLSCAYEPLLSPIFDDALADLAASGVPETWIVTNGTLLTRARSEAIVAAGVSHLSVSIDAATAPTYERIRVNARFDRLLANLRRLGEIKRARSSRRPHLHSDVTLMRSNIEELAALVSLAAELGFESVTCRHLLPYAGVPLDDELLFPHRELTNRCVRAAHQVARRAGVRLVCPELTAPADPARPRRDDFARYCSQPWTGLYIRSDGETAPCSWYEGQISTGNITRQGLDEIRRHPFARSLRRAFLRGRLPPTCVYCLQDQSNRFPKVPFDVLSRVRP